MSHRNQFTAKKDWKPNPERNSAISLTEPDQVLSVKELLRRHVQGLPVPTYTPVYDEHGEYPDVRHMDLVDVEELKQKQRDVQEAFKKQQKAATKKAADRAGGTPEDSKAGKDQPPAGPKNASAAGLGPAKASDSSDKGGDA